MTSIFFCYSVILQNLTHHPVCQIHPAPSWSHERTFTFRLRSPRPYQDTKLLCLSTFVNVKRTYEREKDGRNTGKREGKVLRTFENIMYSSCDVSTELTVGHFTWFITSQTITCSSSWVTDLWVVGLPNCKSTDTERDIGVSRCVHWHMHIEICTHSQAQTSFLSR